MFHSVLIFKGLAEHHAKKAGALPAFSLVHHDHGSIAVNP